MNKTTKGAIIGTGGGAAAGALIGRAAGNTALGAIIGGAVGGTAGTLIGRRMDRQAEEIRRQVPNATVERVGEGIDIEFDSKVLFATGRATLQAAAQETLNSLIAILNKYPDTNIEIQGHTDNTGPDEVNERLSLERAESVRNYLTNAGISGSRLTVKGMGERFAKYTNDTEEGRAKNRRVEFLISANEKMKQEAQREAQSN